MKPVHFEMLDDSAAAPAAREIKTYGHGRYSVWTDGETAAVFAKSRVEPFRLLSDVRLGLTPKGDPVLFGRDRVSGPLLAMCSPLCEANIEWRGTKAALVGKPARIAPGALVKEAAK